MARTYFTICSSNYLAYARTLYASLKSADPEAAEGFILFLVDDDLPEAEKQKDEFRIILAKQLNIPEFWDMAFRYSVMEFNTAVKPFCIQYIHDHIGSDAAIYLDPDIYVLSPLNAVHAALDNQADVVLTPHICNPLKDEKHPHDITFMQTGIYNLGFGAFADTTSCRDLIAWWAVQLKKNCRVDLENGIFVDQKFMDMAPAFVNKCEILRHPGYNIAYWNLLNRTVEKSGSQYFINGEPISFFHFSVIVPGNYSIFSKHQDRFEPTDLGECAELFETYLTQLEFWGHSELKNIPYAYNYFSNGEKIPDLLRKIYSRTQDTSTLGKDKIFSPDVEWANAPAKDISSRLGVPATLVMEEIWSARPDLNTIFAIHTDIGFEQFCRWFIASAPSEYDLPQSLVEPVQNALDAAQKISGGQLRSPTQWIAKKAISATPIFRGAYRRLPHKVRVKIRQTIVNKAGNLEPNYDNKLSSRGSLSQDLPPGVSLYGYLDSISGVGEGARRNIDCLRKAGIDHTSFNVVNGQNGSLSISSSQKMNRLRPAHQVALFHVNADQVPRVMAEIPSAQLEGVYRIGYWAWELSEFPNEWIDAFEYLDEVWVCSEFVKLAVKKKTSRPVKVLPHAIPEYANKTAERTEFGLPDHKFLFFYSFDLNSYSTRKNPGDVYKAFKAAFGDANSFDDPMLVVKSHGSLTRDARWNALVEKLESDPRVVLFDMEMDQDRYQRLQSTCNAFVSLHRSEGFGLNMAEFMAMGKPVIATAYGGNLDFMTSENSYLVDFHLVPVGDENYIHGKDQYWAQPNIDHAAKLMREVAAQNGTSKTKIENALSLMQSKYSTANVGSKMQKYLSRIEAAFKV